MLKKYFIHSHFIFFFIVCFCFFCTSVSYGLHEGCYIEENRQPTPPYISGDAFRAYADFIFDETNDRLDSKKIPDKSIIFVGPYLLQKFFREHHHRIKGRYILITHNTDYETPGPYKEFLDDEKIIAWFSQNVEHVIHPKLFPIPIGLGNRYAYNVSLIDHLRQNNSFRNSRDILLYMSFTGTPNDVPERKTCAALFKNYPYCTYYEKMIPYDNYLSNLQRSKFVLSPRGWGLDCHRTWEALYLGAIPIVKTSASDKMFDDLPVLIIHDWKEINEQFLLSSFEIMTQKSYNFEKLHISYWLELIEKIRSDGLLVETD